MGCMKIAAQPSPSYRGYHFPAAIIAHCTWLYFRLYFRFCLSFRDVQELMLERGIEVSHETIRLWTLKFGAEYARRLRRREGRSVTHGISMRCSAKSMANRSTCGARLTQDGEVLDVLVQKRRNAKAAKRFFRKLLKGVKYAPRAIVTDKLQSYVAARREVMPGVEHRKGGRLNNRAENSHQSTRRHHGPARRECDVQLSNLGGGLRMPRWLR